MKDLPFTSAIELARLMQSGEISPVELAQSLLERIDEVDPHLHAFVTVSAERAIADAHAAEGRLRRGEARSLLDGIPYSVKDVEPTAGVRTTFGSRWFEDHIPQADSIVVARMRRAGGTLLGKTNTPHFAYKDMTDNLLGPPTVNPWDTTRTPGGSSGGAAAAVAAGLGPVAIGSDGGGSIRIPASLCGVVGFKPSSGRVPTEFAQDYWDAYSQPGPITRTVRDAALVLSELAGPDSRDPLSIDAPADDYVAACDGGVSGLRIAWSPDLGHAAVDPEIRALTERAAGRFADFGAHVELPPIPWSNPQAEFETSLRVRQATRFLESASDRPDWTEPTLMRIILGALPYSAVDFRRSALARTALYRSVHAFFEDWDLLLTPTTPLAAWDSSPGPHEGPAEIDGRPMRNFHDRIPFTYLFNMTGFPAASVPCGFTASGLPIGLQIVGGWHADALVLRAAAAFEAAEPWSHHRPTTLRVDEE